MGVQCGAGSQIVSFAKIAGGKAKKLLSQTSQGDKTRKSRVHINRDGDETRADSQIVSFAKIVGESPKSYFHKHRSGG